MFDVNGIIVASAVVEDELTSEIEHAVDAVREIGIAGLWNSFVEDFKASLPRITYVLLFLICAFAVIWITTRIVRRALRRSKVDPMLHYFIVSLVKYASLGVTFIVAMGMLGLPLTPVITALGAVSLAFSLAIKDSLANLAGGVFLLFNRPFKTGDYIELKGVTGTVTEIRLTYTVLQTNYNRHIFVPNGDFSSATITNYSMSDKRCIELTFSVKPDSDIARAREIILSVLKENELIMLHPEPSVMVSDHTELWVRLLCKAWVEPENMLAIKSQTIEKARMLLTREGM